MEPARCRVEPARVRLPQTRRSGRTVNVCAGVCEAGRSPLHFQLLSSATSRMISAAEAAAISADAQRRKSVLKVPCMPLGQMLRELHVPALDYMSLDVEGVSRAQHSATWHTRRAAPQLRLSDSHGHGLKFPMHAS